MGIAAEIFCYSKKEERWRAGEVKIKKGMMKEEREGKKLKRKRRAGEAKVKKWKMKKERRERKEGVFLAEMGGCCLVGIEQNFGEGGGEVGRGWAEWSNGRVLGG